MFVSRSMTIKVVTIRPEATILEAQKMMATHQIRHLPVIDGEDRLIGVVTDRDVRSILPYDCYKDPGCTEEQEKVAGLKIKDIMAVEPLTISPSDTIQDALLLIQEKRVGAFPVVDDTGKLKGIISVRDLLRAFTNVLGIGEPGMLLCILVEEKIGQMKKIVDAITGEGISVGSILVARYWEEDKRAVFPYLLTQNISRVKKKLREMGFTLLEPMDWYLDQLPKHE
ncbi:MAG: CBS domain-containing protein [Deltaproteobacteria bacterium]|nr:MAG: CBS domain-containing protein [Deltaproteobacteria bacterium]RLC13775.1 MAG: CBS domain-containing protein [Deltaproteobacteria bacterium]HHE75268.1 CBS domain-containing protein [Desulfobacteraceae bacterium]